MEWTRLTSRFKSAAISEALQRLSFLLNGLGSRRAVSTRISASVNTVRPTRYSLMVATLGGGQGATQGTRGNFVEEDV